MCASVTLRGQKGAGAPWLTVATLAICVCTKALHAATATDLVLVGGQDGSVLVINQRTNHLIQKITTTSESVSGVSVPVLLSAGKKLAFAAVVTQLDGNAPLVSKVIKIDSITYVKNGAANVTASPSLLSSTLTSINSMALSADGTTLYYGSPRISGVPGSGLGIVVTKTMSTTSNSLVPETTPDFDKLLGLTKDSLDLYYVKKFPATATADKDGNTDSGLFFVPITQPSAVSAPNQILAGNLVEPTALVSNENNKTTLAIYKTQVNTNGVPPSKTGMLASFSEITNSVTTSPVGLEPIKILLNRTGNSVAYVLNKGTNDISVVNTSDLSLAASLSLGGNNAPMDMALNTDGATIYVASENSKSLTVVSTADGSTSSLDLTTIKDDTRNTGAMLNVAVPNSVAVLAAAQDSLTITSYQFILPAKASQKIINSNDYLYPKVLDKIVLAGTFHITHSADLKPAAFNAVSFNISGITDVYQFEKGLAQSAAGTPQFKFRAPVIRAINAKFLIPTTIPFRLVMQGHFRSSLTSNGVLKSSIPVTIYIGGTNFITTLNVTFKDNGIVAIAVSPPPATK